MNPRDLKVFEAPPNRYQVILQERRQRKFEQKERKREIPHLNKHTRGKKKWEMWAE